MRKLLTLFAGIILCTSAFAQEQALLSSQISTDPVSMSMAGASTASAQRIAMSAFSNAAVMPFYSGKLDINASYNRWSPAGQLSNRGAFGAAFKVKDTFAMSVAGVYGTGQEYDIIDEYGAPQGTFKTSDMKFGVGLAFGFAEHYSLGVNASYAMEKLYEDYTIGGVLIGASFAYHGYGVTATAGISSVGPKVKDDSGNAFATPASAGAAVAYDLELPLDMALQFAADFSYYFNGGLGAAVGAQYSWNDMVFVRAGYHYGSSKSPLPQYVGMGVGAKFFGVHVDLSYITANMAVGNTVAVSLGYSF